MSEPAFLRNKKVWWSITITYLLLIYVSLHYTPGYAAWLIKTMGKSAFVSMINGILGMALLLVLGAVLLRPPKKWWEVVIPAIVTFLMALSLQNAEERIHFPIYGLLGLLCYFSLKKQEKKEIYWKGFLLVIAAGWLDEIIQAFLPNRYYDIKDVAIDGISGCLGVWVGRYCHWHIFNHSVASPYVMENTAPHEPDSSRHG